MKSDHKARGSRGEELAARFLKKQGYKILETNYRCALGEIDIIARHKKVLAFVEVKTRTSTAFGHPKSAVTPKKQRKISMVALEYLKKNRKLDQPARFDVVSILSDGEDPKIEIIQNAFELAYP
ncbi:YraN family protein [Desulfatibacillum aliphaticivorans]|uniref:UPF0102 protein Dalk_4642 n=1 Tax=Desulfatibacillum aliphaticivorans TaxID=218208 RepID=B8FNN9_DESAL|nr:YraN family protein [Desulfatibacillum aliphaticivorans]ACL06320.1 protein of unknown function UPF0102 [Desulfatibacillum aliphaticivorans]